MPHTQQQKSDMVELESLARAVLATFGTEAFDSAFDRAEAIAARRGPAMQQPIFESDNVTLYGMDPMASALLVELRRLLRPH
jgi:hypothetical protein